ncbi:MAG TPA: lamin tail domain-containing protein [Candidatus Cloacimonadota bacterium]|nr:lamin tail domain-containing protein [Candidatus Cloacimonadota bacterium]
MNMRVILLGLLFLSMASIVMAQATDLFISEYVEGTSNQKAIEIFNGTGAPVDLSQYSLKKQTNGAGAFGNELVLSGTLANNDCYVIVVSSTTGTTLESQPYVDLATTSYAMAFNGNDCVALCKNGALLDVVGVVDQTANWGTDMTLRRLATVYMPRTIWDINEWEQLPVNNFDGLGSHTFTGGTNDPIISIATPNGGEQWNVGSTYVIAWAHAHFDGQVKIELMDGATPTTLVEAIDDTGSWSWAIPTSLALGTNYKIKISSVTGTPTDMSDNTFSLIAAVPIIDCANLAALRAATADNTTIYRVTGEAYITYMRSTRNQKYIEDNSGAVLVDDPNGVITSQYGRWDGMTGLKGKLTTYHAQFEFVPIQDPGNPTSINHVLAPQDVNLTTLTANFNDYNQELIRLSNASFLPDTTGGVFVGTRSYNITDNSGGSMIFRTNFADADYIGTSIPTTPKSIVALAIPYDTQLQISARDLADFGPVANDDPVVSATTPMLYGNLPNPFTSSTSIRFDAKSNHPVSITVYNVRGQKVATIVNNERTTGAQSIQWNGTDDNGNKLPAGVYLYKMKSGSFSSTKKMILMK